MVIKELNVRFLNFFYILLVIVFVSNDKYLISFLFFSMRKEIMFKKI